MKLKLGIVLSFLVIMIAGCATGPTPQPGWYPNIVRFDEVNEYAGVPRQKGVAIIDSRPGARKYDKGHIAGAINIPERSFDKMKDKLPENKADLLIFYCGGLKCMLSHKSAFKAEKLGYTNIKVYAEGYPDWKTNNGMIAVSLGHLKKLIDKKAKMVVIDSRPKARKYDKGHIPGAISIPDREFDKYADKLPADKTTPLYFYCGGYKCKLSPNSADKAKAMGYNKVYIVPEGYPGWKKAYGKGAVYKAPEIKGGKDGGTISIASFKQILKEAPDTMLVVDVRDSEEFSSGTIKGAMNMPINDLEKRMDELPSDKSIVFFCGTGGRAGEAYDIVMMFKPDLKAYFLNAEVTIMSDGSYTIAEIKD